jgi:hypothetical protein
VGSWLMRLCTFEIIRRFSVVEDSAFSFREGGLVYLFIVM